MVKNQPAIAGDIRDVGSSLGQEDPLEEGKPPQYCCLENWKIPWTEELARLQSIGSKRVRHD